MGPIVLTSAYGYSTAFKITSAKVYTLDFYMHNWELYRFPSLVWVTFVNNDEAKTKKLTPALIKKEFPEYMNFPWYLHYTQ